MQRKNQALLNLLNALVDACLIMTAYFLSVWLRLVVLTDKPESLDLVLAPKVLLAAAASAAVMVVLYHVLGLYGTFRYENLGQEAFYLAVANALGILVVGTALYVFRFEDFARLALFYFYVLSWAFVFVKRLLLRRVLAASRARGFDCRTVLVVGADALAQRYYRNVVCDIRYGYVFGGYFAPQACEALPGYQGGYDAVRAALAAGQADELVIALEQADAALIGTLVSACGRFGVKVSVIPPYNDFIPSTPRMEPVGGLKLMTVRSAPDKGMLWAAEKRAMDLVLSLLGILVLSPIMLIAAVAVKLSSPGPVIFKQQRAGKNGRPFAMYKFRSMYQDAEARLVELQALNEADGPAFKIANDPRITRAGRFLRKTSIDELPQMFNILKGNMSVVGPRPPLLTEVAQYTDWDWGRLTVKPGLTCYWQISGRSDVSFAEWMQLDLKYVEEQGFFTDVKIILRTVGVVLRGKGAY